MSSSVIIGIAGTAKNTGKTTALNALLRESERTATTVGVTSIGYDGEAIDNVTGLPKPRVFLPHGSIVTTSQSCVPARGWDILEHTGYATALGEVLILKCAEPGPIVLAGPNKRVELEEVIRRMRRYKPSIVIVDGALNRIAPLAVADEIILATGAARNINSGALAEETQAIALIMGIGKLSAATADIVDLGPVPSLHDVQKALAGAGPGPRWLVFPGLLPIEILQSVADEVTARPGLLAAISIRDPFALILSADIIRCAEAIRKIEKSGAQVCCTRSITLRAITVNPFYPDFSGNTYIPSTVEPEMLRSVMRSKISIPVVDILNDGAVGLWNLIRNTFAA